MSIPLGFSLVDLLALVFFFASWVLFHFLSTHSRWQEQTITYQMNLYRVAWMSNMVRRDPVMPDVLIQTSLQQGVGFFASTSILVIGALFAALGASEQALNILKDFPFAIETTKTQWEFKVLMLACLFVFAFFKFAWSLRLFNYVAILLGAAPGHGLDSGAGDDAVEEQETRRRQYANRLARLHALGASHFTAGLNAYFFALAALSWFIGPWVFIVATIWVTLVMYRRAFRSKFLKILTDEM